MVSGCGSNILVWRFNNGCLTKENKLLGHVGYVYCIVYSKKHNWFVSSSVDNTILCWRNQYNNDWICGNSGKTTHSVSCLLLNNDENQVISCSSDSSIIVWKTDIKNNRLDYDYTLEQRHSKGVYGISINEEETFLVSCSED